MVRVQCLSALLLGLSLASATAQQQQSVEAQVQLSVMHAAFYLKANGRAAEAACYMRQAQRLDLDPQSAIKDYYKTVGFEDPRLVFMRSISWTSVSHHDANLSAVARTADLAALWITKRQWPAAIDDSRRVAEAVRLAYGDKDLRYADILSIVGDLQAFNHDFAAAGGTLDQVSIIRLSIGPSDDVQPTDPRNKVMAHLNLARTVSKMADIYWILGQDQRAAKLRGYPLARAGDGYRIGDIDFFIDRKVPDRSPLHPNHPSCVASMGSH